MIKELKIPRMSALPSYPFLGYVCPYLVLFSEINAENIYFENFPKFVYQVYYYFRTNFFQNRSLIGILIICRSIDDQWFQNRLTIKRWSLNDTFDGLREV
jgi:hypothetical protein